MLKGPTFRFRSGRVVEMEHSSGRFGYLIAHFRRPRIGKFFTLVTKAFDEPLAVERIESLLSLPTTTVWLNSYRLLSSRGAYTFRHKCDLQNYTAPEPSVWFGSVDHWITIQHPDGTQETHHTKLSEREWEAKMERERIVHMVLWLPEDVGDFLFNGVPLRWSVHKKY